MTRTIKTGQSTTEESANQNTTLSVSINAVAETIGKSPGIKAQADHGAIGTTTTGPALAGALSPF